jgi:hypothetical protein
MAKKRPTVENVIRGALVLVENPKTWTRDVSARTRSGNRVDATSPHAVCWCAHGALLKSAFHLTGGDRATSFNLKDAATRKLERLAGGSLGVLNDDVGHKAVVALFKQALAA